MLINNNDTQKILLIDHQSPEIEQLQHILQESYFIPYLCLTSEEAYNVCLQQPPRLIMSELFLQPFNGIELYKKIRNNLATRDVPFILTSKQIDLEEKLKIMELGIDDYISKPYNPEEVACRIESILQELEAKFDDAYRLESGFSGSLEEMNLVDLIQTLELGDKSATIQLNRHQTEGKVYVQKGVVVDATFLSLEPEKALEYLMSWIYGVFQLQIQSVQREKKINILNRELYYISNHFNQVGKELLSELPPLNTLISYDKATILNGLSEEEKQLISIIRKNSTFYQILATSPFNDIKTLQIVKNLNDKNYLNFTKENILKSQVIPLDREIVEQVNRARKKNKNTLHTITSFFKTAKTNKTNDLSTNKNMNHPEEQLDKLNQSLYLYLQRSDLLLIRQKLTS